MYFEFPCESFHVTELHLVCSHINVTYVVHSMPDYQVSLSVWAK